MMRIYGGNILAQDRDYISDEAESLFCGTLQEADRKKLFTYIVYKMVCFVEAFHDTQITRGHFHWKVDEFRRPVLFNTYKLHYVEQPKFDWTNEVAAKRVR